MIDISSLFPDLEALSPDGRWNMLQDWLKKNPEYGERVEDWAKWTPDDVFVAVCELATKKYGVLGALGATAMKPKIMRTIETLQTLYRERAGQQTEKEIKHVRPRRQVKRRSAKNHRRTNAGVSAKPKRPGDRDGD